MKNIALTLSFAFTLAIASCVGVQPGNVPTAPDGPVARTVERVLQRTEAYMAAEVPPLPIPAEAQGQVAAAVSTARTMLASPEASGDLLLMTMAPIMMLHDAMVNADASLDQLERDIYLEDTARLRSLFESVNIYAVN